MKGKHAKLVAILGLITIGMFGFGYAMVPLYNVLCKALGINGKTGGATAEGRYVDKSRQIHIVFLATNNEGLNWTFYPVTKKITVHPGENKRIAYFATNNTHKTMTIQAIPSVTPGLAAKYLKKTECFCFTQQTLKGKESMKMPILFHIDKDLPENIHEIALSYTLFDITGRVKNKVDSQKQGRIN